MKPVFYDTHAHLDFPEFSADLEQVVARAEAAGIGRLITIGTTLETSRKAVGLAERFPNVFAAVGWHPSHAEEGPEDLPEEFRELARHERTVAIGECGLDYSRLPAGGSAEAVESYRGRQRRYFQRQLELAAEAGLNVIVHQRESFEDALAMIQPFAGKARVVFHCFTGSPGEMRRVLELGGLVSFTGIATFKNAATVRETVRAVPRERFMLETDCPFLAPVPFRGQRCEPAYVAEIASVVAKEKDLSLEELSKLTCATAHDFFPKLRA